MVPKVSVLIPTFNRRHWVGDAIRSALDQGVDVEVLVLDNGSTDGTWSLLEEAAADPRVKPTRWEVNDGREAYPWLLEQARGEYVNFFSDDDLMIPGGLARKVDVLDRMPGIGMVFSPVRYMDQDGADAGEPQWSRIADHDLLGCGDSFTPLVTLNFIPLPAATFRRALAPTGEVFRVGGFGYASDWQFWLTLARRTEFAYLREPTIRLRIHGGQATVTGGIGEGGFADSVVKILRHWMLEADPPYVPSAPAWEEHKRHLVAHLLAAYPGDRERCARELERLEELRRELDRRLEALAGPGAEAFLFAPDWTRTAWIEVVLSYLEAFPPGEPVALVLVPPAEGAPAPEEVRDAVLGLAAATGRTAFPDIVLLDDRSELLDTLRGFPHAQWVPQDPLESHVLQGPLGRRLAEARARMQEGASR